MDLNNFYQDNASSPQNFDIFMDVQDDFFKIMNDYLSQLHRNFVIGQMETYRIIDTQNIPIVEALYNLTDVLLIGRVSELLFQSGLSFDEKIVAWNSMNSNDSLKLDALDIAGKYLELSAQSVYPFEGEPASPAFSVVSMDLYDGEYKFQIGVDFDIRRNRLYLLSERAYSQTLNVNKIFTARCIAIDYDTPSRYIGKNFGLSQYDDFSKDVFNEILSNLTKAALSGPSIRSMRTGVDIITGDKDSCVIYDKFTKNNKRISEWDHYNLTPFDFIIEIPALYMSSVSFSDIVKKYIDSVKLASSNYQVIFNSSYDDTYARHISAEDQSHLFNISMLETDPYNYRFVEPQTNRIDRLIGSTLVTEYVHGYAKFEEGQIKTTDTQTMEETVVYF